ncbi:uncharacterized protein LOC114255646 isoform X2 [Monomorium pharaonis]|uniref:uncharacterized protein LOC114255646 isoform X2 n=1 Tax=Monomorium pharaonis TaxID=307658 RepID=UPI001747A02C|nr:uncharacterized protein LOC114255646 isoform X2 [Monomorium pharaonis]
MQGYQKCYYDAQQNFYPSTDQNLIVRCKSFEGEKRIIFQNIDDLENEKSLKLRKNFNNKTHQKASLNFDEEELLILEVRARELLWNFQLNIQERNIKVTNKLWKEVSEAIGGKISAKGAKQKFKSLHDTYRKIIQAENLPSGSARKNLEQFQTCVPSRQNRLPMLMMKIILLPISFQ